MDIAVADFQTLSMNNLPEKQQAEFTANYYYSCLYNSLVLFAATPAYLEKLDEPYFDVPFELETEYMYAFDEPVFGGNFKSGRVAEYLREDLLEFKKKVDLLPNELWQWEEILSSNQWIPVRQFAEKILVKLGETRREYDSSFTTIIHI